MKRRRALPALCLRQVLRFLARQGVSLEGR
jgi:hypothetical protein